MQAGQVTLTDISKFYKSVCVLDSIDISVKAGEFLVLLGPSGCGKSTLLRMIAGLDTISRGELQIDARSANDLHPRDRDIAMVFPELCPLSAHDGGRKHRLSVADRADRQGDVHQSGG